MICIVIHTRIRITGRFKGYFLSVHMANLSATGLKLLAHLQFAPKTFEMNELEPPATVKLPPNRVSFWSSTPNNLVFLPVDSAMASAHNGIFRVACNAEYPDLKQLLLYNIISRKNNMAISVTAETHAW